MNSKEDLQLTIARAQAQLNKILDAEQLEKNRALVGKCFKYPNNCYSLPKKPSDYWPVYQKITSADYGGCNAMEFQTDSHGGITIKFKTWAHQSGYVPITHAEFEKAWRKVQSKVAKHKA